MAAMNRRTMIMDILPGAAVAIVAVGTVGWTVAPEIADATPLGIAKGAHNKMDDDLVQKAQVVVVGPRRRRHRRRVCWWHRGRRVCGWR